MNILLIETHFWIIFIYDIYRIRGTGIKIPQNMWEERTYYISKN